MNKFFIIILIVLCFQTSFGQENNQIQSIYQFKVIDINKDTFDFAKLQGKKIMVVNTASKCMYTPQYKGLQILYDSYKDSGFIIVAFPCNDFANREPYNNHSIKNFCKKKYGVTFPLMAKISVKGEKQIPLYKYLTTKSLNGYSDNKVEWNFQKYLINEQGFLEMVISPKKGPMSEEVLDWVKE